jgi:ariadne-1
MMLDEAKEREAELAARLYECGICGDEHPIEDMLTLQCDHRFCKGCFLLFCEHKIKEAAVKADQLACPCDDCDKDISIHELRANLPEELFSKYERHRLRAFAKDSNARFCPKCQEWFCEVRGRVLRPPW